MRTLARCHIIVISAFRRFYNSSFGHLKLKIRFWKKQGTSFASCTHTHTQPFCGPFFRDHPGESVPEKNFWTLRCKGR